LIGAAGGRRDAAQVWIRWMTVACESSEPPAGPRLAPARCSSSQGMLLAPDDRGVVDGLRRAAHARLLSKEARHVARVTPASSGFGLKKCVVTCCSKPNSADEQRRRGPTKRRQAGAGRQAEVVLGAEGVRAHGVAPRE
jgi:hypothetical protein